MLDTLATLIEASGPWMYVLAPLFMIAVAVLPFPAEVPAMVNGMIFGPWWGAGATWGGALLGAWISFELARRFGRPLGARLLSAHAVERADRAVCSAGWPGLLAVRLVPTVAFTLVNWGAGLTCIPRWTFLWTTALGIVPGAVVFTASGTGLGALYRRNPQLGIAIGVTVLLIAAWAVVRFRGSVRRAGHVTE